MNFWPLPQKPLSFQNLQAKCDEIWWGYLQVIWLSCIKRWDKFDFHDKNKSFSKLRYLFSKMQFSHGLPDHIQQFLGMIFGAMKIWPWVYKMPVRKLKFHCFFGHSIWYGLFTCYSIIFSPHDIFMELLLYNYSFWQKLTFIQYVELAVMVPEQLRPFLIQIDMTEFSPFISVQNHHWKNPDFKSNKISI